MRVGKEYTEAFRRAIPESANAHEARVSAESQIYEPHNIYTCRGCERCGHVREIAQRLIQGVEC